MGNAVTSGPLDASDITNLDDAKSEIIKLRTYISKKKVLTEANIPKSFRDERDTSLSMKLITEDWYKKYMNVIGPRGYTFDMAIQCGIDGRSITGMAIPDEESYYLWKDWYDYMIEKKHGHPKDAKHVTDLDTSKIDASKIPDDLDKYCVSTRIRAARNIKGYGLPPASTRQERREVESLVKDALTGLTGELKGKYFSLTSMSKDEETQLQDDHFLFQKPNPNAMIYSCGGVRDWPDGRGIYHNEDKTFLVWVNEEDQMRVISMQKGGNVAEVFKRWALGVNEVEKCLKVKDKEYMYDEHIGQFSSCVSNVGTGLRASMHIKLPKLIEALTQHGLEDLCRSMDMDCRGTGGEHTNAGKDGKVDISNIHRIGKSEVQLVQIMINGICKLIELEKIGEKDGVDALKKAAKL